MVDFTIFRNINTNHFAAVYDFNLPTQTGIGEKECWVPLYHEKTTGLLDKVRQCKEFEKEYLRKEAAEGK